MSNTAPGFQQNGDRAARALVREWHRLATRVGRALQVPMSILGLLWLVLIVVNLTRGLSPLLRDVSYVIWGLFVLQFVLAFIIAPRKLAYIRRNRLTVLALLLLAVYGFAVFGYITATIASFFVARDADSSHGELAGARQLERVERELASLQRKLDKLAV